MAKQTESEFVDILKALDTRIKLLEIANKIIEDRIEDLEDSVGRLRKE